jgi:hypothetical protein
MAGLPQPSRLTNAIIESALVGLAAVLGLVGLPMVWVGLSAGAAAAWWVLRNLSVIGDIAAVAPLRLVWLVPVSLGLIVAVHLGAFWIASSLHWTG